MFSVNNTGNSGGAIPPSSLVDEVEGEVRRRIAAGDSFTAFDISRAVQAAGVQERHRNMKTIVHDMYERGEMTGYTRTLITLPTGEKPYLYHPDNAMIPNRFAVASNTRSHTVTGHTAILFGQRSSTTQILGGLDNGNRLSLPLSLLRKAGFLPGDTVYVLRDTSAGTLTLSAHRANAPDTRPVRAQQISHYSLRLTLGHIVQRIARRFQVTIMAPGRIEIKPQ